MTPPMSKTQLDEIDARAAHLYEYVQQTDDADRLAGEDVPALLARIAELEAELAKYVGHEPTLDEEARYVHEQQVRKQIAQDVNRAERPTFAPTEDPELVVKVTRAIDIRLIEMGDQAPYWVPEGGAK